MKRQIIECAALLVTFLVMVAIASPTRVDLVTRRGSLTNQVPCLTNSFVSTEQSEFFTTQGTASPYSLYLEAVEGIEVWMSETPSQEIFSVQDHVNAIYRRNVDLSCMSVWNSREGIFRAGVLIAPAKVLFVGHYHLYAGDIMRFVGRHNEVYSRIVSHTESVYTGNAGDDLCVGWLDSPLPIEPVKLVPLGLVPNGYQFSTAPPCLGTDRQGRWCVHEALYMYDSGGATLAYPNKVYPYGDDHTLGESGSPVFMYYLGEWRLFGLFQSMNKGLICPSQAKIDALVGRWEQ